jgi:pyruvate dehydrogenase E2 component (dihydrolipoamide acetyltransferase)
MASRVVMPKLSDTMEEGKILRWLRKEGDRVETGQTLAEIETDKATVEMEAYTTGTLLKIVAKDGATAKIGNLIAVIGSVGEDISDLIGEPPAGAAPPLVAAAAPAAAAGEVQGERRAAGGPGLRASPLALRMAADAGLELRQIQGSGPQGRIIKRDIEAALAAGSRSATPAGAALPASAPAVGTSQPVGAAEFQDVELSTMRQTIARRLIQSKAPVPHFYLTIDIGMDRVWEARQAFREEQSPITINDIIIKAAASALRRHPELNASFAGDHLRRHGRIHIGVAVAVEDGLVTPVIRDADRKTLEEISAEARLLVERSRARRLQPDEYTGATFSVSNLGMMGIEAFSAIINPPEAAVLAVGAVRQVPVVDNGAIKAAYRMKATLSVDHRVADGAVGARFLQTLQRLLENPVLIG